MPRSKPAQPATWENEPCARRDRDFRTPSGECNVANIVAAEGLEQPWQSKGRLSGIIVKRVRAIHARHVRCPPVVGRVWSRQPTILRLFPPPEHHPQVPTSMSRRRCKIDCCELQTTSQRPLTQIRGILLSKRYSTDSFADTQISFARTTSPIIRLETSITMSASSD